MYSEMHHSSSQPPTAPRSSCGSSNESSPGDRATLSSSAARRKKCENVRIVQHLDHTQDNRGCVRGHRQEPGCQEHILSVGLTSCCDMSLASMGIVSLVGFLPARTWTGFSFFNIWTLLFAKSF